MDYTSEDFKETNLLYSQERVQISQLFFKSYSNDDNHINLEEIWKLFDTFPVNE